MTERPQDLEGCRLSRALPADGSCSTTGLGLAVELPQRGDERPPAATPRTTDRQATGTARRRRVGGDVEERVGEDEAADRDRDRRRDRGDEEPVRRRRAARGDDRELVRLHVYRSDHVGVVVDRDRRGDDADDGEPRPAAVDHRREDVELPRKMPAGGSR
jgi:hypothetical protein